jgi:predicted dehydrogenase
LKSIVLSGCGNIGFRHLQAMLAMPDPAEIIIVEPNAAAHERIAALFAPAEAKGFRFDLRTAVPAASRRFDLAVIATSADIRRAAFDALIGSHEVGVMILEKVLFQTKADLEEVGQILTDRGIAAYVNCPRRYFPGYRALLSSVASKRPLNLAIRGAGFGLASNGVHLIDLAEYLNDATLISFEASGLKDGSVTAKRAGCVEVFGVVSGTLSNGATLSISCDSSDAISISVALQGSEFVAEIDEMARQISIGSSHAVAFSSKFVSELWEIYNEALNTGRCGLTPYEDSARQHRFFLAALTKHLKLDPNSPCPIS